MKRSIVRYFRLIVSIILLLSVLMPSYATISSSDGSSFVTKAEFDSALSEFNSRLTTFEAGINSKIDSQVTSYLDRNGIWSKKEQNVVGATSCTLGRAQYWSYESILKNMVADRGLTWKSRSLYTQSETSSFWGSISQQNYDLTKGMTKWTFVDGITKSGLCHLVYDSFNSSNSVSNTWTKFNNGEAFSSSTDSGIFDLWNVNNNSTMGVDFFLTGGIYFNWKISICNDDDSVVDDMVINNNTLRTQFINGVTPNGTPSYNSSATGTSVYWAGSYNAVLNQNLYFFVSRNQKLKVMPYVILNLNTSNGPSIMSTGQLITYGYNNVVFGVRKVGVY